MKPGRKITVAKKVTFIKHKSKPKPKKRREPAVTVSSEPELEPEPLFEEPLEQDEPMAKTADEEPEVESTGAAVPSPPSAKDRLSAFTDMLTMQHVHAGPVAPHMLQELHAIMGML